MLLSNEMLCGFMALYNYLGPLAPRLNFVKNSLTYFYSLFISSYALLLIAERLASVTADISFKVFYQHFKQASYRCKLKAQIAVFSFTH